MLQCNMQRPVQSNGKSKGYCILAALTARMEHCWSIDMWWCVGRVGLAVDEQSYEKEHPDNDKHGWKRYSLRSCLTKKWGQTTTNSV